MGTSSSYGGSGKQTWSRTRELFVGVGGDDDGTPAAVVPGEPDLPANDVGGDEPPDAALDALGQALADALVGDDPTLRPGLGGGAYELPALLPVLRARGRGGLGIGGGGGGSVRGQSDTAGRVGGGSRRSVLRSAARGGVALGAAFALRGGDREALAEAGLDLDELNAMGPRMQVATILDAVLGEAAHPDETVLREVVAEQLKQILQANAQEADALRGFIASLVFRLGLVELRSGIKAGTIPVDQALRTETRLKEWIRARIRGMRFPGAGQLSMRDFMEVATRMTRDAIALLRAGR